MTKNNAIKILTAYNKWRRGEGDKLTVSPEVIGLAIDYAIKKLRPK